MITLFTGYDEEPKKKEEQAAEEEQAQKSGVPNDKSSSSGWQSGFFSRMRDAVTRTRENFSSRINEIVALTREVDEARDLPLEQSHQRRRQMAGPGGTARLVGDDVDGVAVAGEAQHRGREVRAADTEQPRAACDRV